MPRFLLSKCFIIGFYDDFSLFSLPSTASQAILCDSHRVDMRNFILTRIYMQNIILDHDNQDITINMEHEMVWEYHHGTITITYQDCALRVVVQGRIECLKQLINNYCLNFFNKNVKCSPCSASVPTHY